MSNKIKLLGLGAIGLLTAAIVWTASAGPSGQADAHPSEGPSLSVPSPSVIEPPAPPVASYPDQVLGADAPPEPTGVKAQSKLWVANGSWWAVMLDPVSRTYRIYELVDSGKAWRDTGTVIDERPQAQPDALWDGSHLYLASGVRTTSASGAALLSRYSFNAKDRRFTLDPNFPVPITPAGVDSIVLTRDTTGKLWTAYIADDGQVMLSRTLGNDLFWGTPFPLALDHSQVTKGDIATILAYGPGKVAVLWGSGADGAYYMTSHEDGDPDNAWSAPEVAIGGRDLASDQLKAIAAPDGRLYAVVKTAVDDDPSSNGRAPQILVLARAVDGTWSSVLYSRLQDQHASPAVALDPAAGMLYVVATTPKRGGTVNYKRTATDGLSFPTGLGETFITDPTATSIARATSTKDPVTPESGLVFLAYDSVATRYVHGIMDLGQGVAAGTMPAAPPVAVVRPIFVDDFDPWPVGSSPDTLWKLGPDDPAKAFTIVAAPSATDRSASIAARVAGRDIQVCRALPATKTGDLTVDTRVRLARTGPTDGVMTEVRGSNDVAASVRFGRSGFFAYYRGAAKIITLVPVRAGAWYRSIVVVHTARKTYDWQLLDAKGRRLIVVRGAPWRKASPAPLDKVCLRTPTGGRGIGLAWEDISVTR